MVKKKFVKSGKNNKSYRFGQFVICRYIHPDGSKKPRPVMIYGGPYITDMGEQYYTVIPPTTRFSNYPDNFSMRSSFLSNNIDKNPFLLTSDTSLLSDDYFDNQKGVLHSLKPDYFPDVIARRIQGLLFNPQSQFYTLLGVPNIIRAVQAVTLSTIEPQMVKSGEIPFDIVDGLAHHNIKGIDPELPKNMHDIFLSENLKALTLWVRAHAQSCIENREKIEFPTPGTWPNWPDVTFNGQTYSCRAGETHQETIIKPKTDVRAAPSAAAKHAAKFGAFKL